MMIAPVVRPTPSPRTRALTDRLRATVAEFQRREPGFTPEEVAHALRELQADTAPADRRTPALVAVVLLAAGMAIAVGVTVATDAASRTPTPRALIAGAVVCGVAAIALLVMRVRTPR